MDGNIDVGILLKRLVDILQIGGAFPRDDLQVPVVKFLHPHEMQMQVNFSLSNTGINKEELDELLKFVVEYSVKTNHQNFHNQLYGGIDPYGLAGSWLSDAMNTNQYTYEVAPVFTLIEQSVLKYMLGKVGFDEGDGIFAPGGSLCNMYALVLARFKAFPETKTKGFQSCPKLIIFTSEGAHYSVDKGANWLGFGTDNLIKVRTDSLGRMDPEHLRQCIEETMQKGFFPLLVNATSGTTVLGAFDPLNEIADICQEYGLWLHVDACWGAALLLSKKYRHKLFGLNRVDSVTWNPHKMLGAPLQCSMFLVKYKELLHDCNCVGASYLFQQDKFYDLSYDTGDKSLQCGRKVDAFKLWVMWKVRGDDGFEILVDNAMDCARYFKDKIMERKGFKLVQKEFECTNICFWYIPPHLREKEQTQSWWEEIDKVAPKIKEYMIKEGSLMVGYTPLSSKNMKNFFRYVTTCHPPPTYEHMDNIISTIEAAGTSC